MDQKTEKLFDEIADKMAESLNISEKDSPDTQAQIFKKWAQSWATLVPQNGNSNRPYNGCNAMLAGMLMQLNGWKHPFFLTFNGIKKMGGNVTKGEKSMPIFWWEMIAIKNNDTGVVEKCFPKLKTFRVFNIAQTDLDASACTIANKDNSTLEDAEKLIENLNITFGEGDPCYIPSQDKICMPSIESFKSTGDYYSAMFHEIGHWTMSETRCNRTGDKKLSYAQEELVAEMTAVFLNAKYGIEGDFQHAEYIGHWIKSLKDHPRSFFDACRMAQKAANFILKEGKATVAEKGEKVA